VRPYVTKPPTRTEDATRGAHHYMRAVALQYSLVFGNRQAAEKYPDLKLKLIKSLNSYTQV
jgi:hypothetical protein